MAGRLAPGRAGLEAHLATSMKALRTTEVTRVKCPPIGSRRSKGPGYEPGTPSDLDLLVGTALHEPATP
jgi:hypothetical protein